MSEVLEFHISCPQCNYSNTATSSIAKYKEVVYQPCNDIEGQQDHNIKDQMRCDNCHNSFDSTGVLDITWWKTMRDREGKMIRIKSTSVSYLRI